MPYIYKITNSINGKSYIGKTSQTIQERWLGHCSDKTRFSERPLYRALNKYGIENFSIIEIEKIENDTIACEREKFWIEFYGTFKNGYNATIGGDGKAYIDYDLVVSTYQQVKNQAEVARILGIHPDTVRNILKIKEEPLVARKDVQRAKNNGKIVNMFDLKGIYIRTFPSIHEAGRFLIDQQLTNCKLNTINTHISEVCRGKRKTAAGFVWQYE